MRFFDSFQAPRYACLAEIFLRQDVGCNLAELLGNIEAIETENDRAVGVLDLGRRTPERDGGIRREAGFGETPRDLHGNAPELRGGRKRNEVRTPYVCCDRRVAGPYFPEVAAGA